MKSMTLRELMTGIHATNAASFTEDFCRIQSGRKSSPPLSKTKDKRQVLELTFVLMKNKKKGYLREGNQVRCRKGCHFSHCSLFIDRKL